MKYNDNQLVAVLQDSRYQNIGALPSQFHGYEWNELFIRPFSVSDYGLISKAAVLGEMSHMVRAVDLVTTQDAADLTIGDFYYILMWLRVHSMPKTPLTVEWECGEQVLRHKETNEVIPNNADYEEPEDRSEYVLEPCDTLNTESIHMVNIDIISLDEEKENVVLPPGFDFPRARHIEGIAAALKDPETAMLVSAAQWFAGKTLADRFAAMRAGTMDDFDMAMALNEKYEHGVREITTLHCRRCRHEEPYIVNMTPLTFFPQSRSKTF